MKYLILISVFFGMLSCKSVYYTYDTELVQVERQINKCIIDTFKYSDTTIVYNDVFLNIKLHLEDTAIKIDVINNYTTSIYLDWLRPEFIDYENNKSAILRCSECDDIHTVDDVTTLAPNTIFSNYLIPSRNIRYVDKMHQSYVPLFPDMRHEKDLSKLNDKTFKIILPFEIEGQTVEYEFLIKLGDITEKI